MTEFNLSDYIISLGMSKENKGKVVPISQIPAQKVKEFIKRLKERLSHRDIRDVLTWNKALEEIDKLAGDKFK